MFKNILRSLVCVCWCASFASAQSITVYADSLAVPIGIQRSANGNLWVAQVGTGNDDGKISVVTTDGRVFDVVTGIPSSLNAATGELVGVWRSYEMPNNRLMVVSGEGSHPYSGTLLTYDLTGFNLGDAPKPLLSFEAAFNVDDYVLAQGNMNSNPYSMVENSAGDWMIVDAGANTIFQRKIGTDTMSILQKFADLSNPTPVGPPVINYVPTKLISDGKDGYYLCNLTGFPFVTGLAKIVHISKTGVVTDYATDLAMLVDIAVDPADSSLVALQFAEFGFAPAPGWTPSTAKLTKIFPNGTKAVLAQGFGPSAGMALAPNGDVFVSAIGSGEILKIALSSAANEPGFDGADVVLSPNPATNEMTVFANGIDTQDAFMTVVDAHGRVMLTQRVASELMLLNLSDMPGGAYYLNLRSGAQQVTRVFVKL